MQSDDVIAKGKERLGDGRRRGRHVQIAPRRQQASLHPRGVDADPASTRRRHHVRVRRTHYAAQTPAATRSDRSSAHRRGRSVASTNTRSSPPNAPTALSGSLRRDPRRAVRRSASPSLPRPRIDRGRERLRIRRLRHRRCTREAESRHDCALVQRGTARAQAASTCSESANRTTSFVAIENGADTFDCVNPSRVARNAAIYVRSGRFNINTSRFRRDFTPIDDECDCYNLRPTTPAAYIHHLFKAKEMLASTLCTIHNERFTVKLVDDIRASIEGGYFHDFKADMLGKVLRPEGTANSGVSRFALLSRRR